MKITVSNRDELFRIELDKVMFFKADDHYTEVYYSKEVKQLLPFGLSYIENVIAGHEASEGTCFVRAGRSYLVSIQNVQFVSQTKELVTFACPQGSGQMTIHLPKVVVRDIFMLLK